MRAIIFTVVAALAANAAVAGESSKVERSTQIRYGDLDPSNPADRAEFQHRLHAAAVKVCTPAPYGMHYERPKIVAKCIQDTVHTTMTSLPAPVQTAFTQRELQEAANP